jgi:tripartite-type tricarboxylate transporter receptor subunit TctC
MKRTIQGLAMAALLGGAGGALAEPVFKDGVLQPLADGFPDRPITLINVDDPGTRDGIYARSLQEAMQGISPVEVLVSDEPAPSFGTFYSVQDIGSREGGNDGYYPIILTIPGSSADILVEPITEETGLTLEDLNLVIGTERIPYVLIQRKDAPWGKTFAELVAHIKANPGEVKYISHQVGTGNDLAMSWIIQQLGLEVNKVPAPSDPQVGAIVGAGEGDFSLAQADIALNAWQAGKVDVLLVTGAQVPPPWDTDPNVVSADAAGLPPASFGLYMGFTVPKGVPPERVEWLYALIKAAAETEVHQKRAGTIPGLTFAIIGPEEAEKVKQDIIAFLDPVVRELGLHIDDR